MCWWFVKEWVRCLYTQLKPFVNDVVHSWLAVVRFGDDECTLSNWALYKHIRPALCTTTCLFFTFHLASMSGHFWEGLQQSECGDQQYEANRLYHSTNSWRLSRLGTAFAIKAKKLWSRNSRRMVASHSLGSYVSGSTFCGEPHDASINDRNVHLVGLRYH